MVKDNLVNLKERNVVRLTQESQQARQQLNSRHNIMSKPSIIGKENKLSAGKILSELQRKFSGRQQEMTDFIETEVKARTEELYKKAHFDALTHLPNRAHFKDLINHTLTKAKETETTFTLLFLDLDGFKAVNDNFGHHIGDELLKHACARLVSSVRKDDIVARLGGDELVVLLTDTDDDLAKVKAISQGIIDEISQAYYLENNEVHVSTSIGIGFYPQDGQTANELMKHADEALYVAKHNGKKQFRFFKDIVTKDEQKKTNSLSHAIDTNTLFTCVEPQINLAENKIVGANIIPRWQDETADQADWKNLLENADRALSLNRWLFDSACYYLSQWQQQNSQFVMTVPMSQALLSQNNIVSSLTKRAEHFGVSKSQLQLSLSLAELTPSIVKTLNKLTKDGFQLTLTDLGKENLDFNLLAGLKIQEFRFHAEWLQAQLNNSQSHQWLQALIQMVKSLDASIIATGIEKEDDYLQLKIWGCEIGQGSYWSEAIRSEHFEGLIA